MKYLSLLALSLIICSCKNKEEHLACFTGDVLLDRGIDKTALLKGTKYYSSSVSELLSPYKYRIINLECPITTIDSPLSKPIVFRGNPELISVLKESMVTHASLANNHANDQGPGGLRDTYNKLSSIGVQTIGAYVAGSTSCQPAEISENGKTIAVFSLLDLRISQEEKNNLCADRKSLSSKIWEYKNNHPNSFVVCYIHWGIEYNPSPSPSQQETAKMLIDAGADALIGHHPHVIQKIDYYKHKPIFYSLGNFVFDQMQPETRLGIVVGLNISNNELQAMVTPYSIENGRPQKLTKDSEHVLEKLIETSRNVVFKKNQDKWLVVEKGDPTVKQSTPQRKKFDSLKIHDKYFQGIVSLDPLNHLKGYRLSLTSDNKKITDELRIPYDVYRFTTGDMNRDGKTDVMLGVIKKTHFDKNEAKRLFALSIDSGQIRPLWLGSRVCQNLVDFKIIGRDQNTVVVTVEQAKDGTYANGLYEWQDFGLGLIRYKKTNLNYEEAIKFFTDEKF